MISDEYLMTNNCLNRDFIKGFRIPKIIFWFNLVEILVQNRGLHFLLRENKIILRRKLNFSLEEIYFLLEGNLRAARRKISSLVKEMNGIKQKAEGRRRESTNQLLSYSVIQLFK